MSIVALEVRRRPMAMSRRAALGCGLAMISVTGRRAWSRATPASGPLSTGEVERLLRQHNVPGAGLAILEAGEIVAAYSYGFARDTSLVGGQHGSRPPPSARLLTPCSSSRSCATEPSILTIPSTSI